MPGVSPVVKGRSSSRSQAAKCFKNPFFMEKFFGLSWPSARKSTIAFVLAAMYPWLIGAVDGLGAAPFLAHSNGWSMLMWVARLPSGGWGFLSLKSSHPGLLLKLHNLDKIKVRMRSSWWSDLNLIHTWNSNDTWISITDIWNQVQQALLVDVNTVKYLTKGLSWPLLDPPLLQLLSKHFLHLTLLLKMAWQCPE